ncbi:transmembrane protein 245 isoform X2 [Leptopilina boulardi]|uniref:transmembrane protein 245 isoform X2 n=1 Tax=Leptopilina boulardi TaxID=63433 RepID=UPI0021F5BFE2|nr:transmembrane protein 245 isoform X2 [Leptopilina boulardi]
MDNLLNKLSGFSVGHEKALKQGIYNALALLLLSFICVAGYGLYIILSPFVKPLIWALLCGSVLFPFKNSLATMVKSWFNITEESNKPLVLHLTIIPLHIVDETSEIIGSFIRNHLKYIIAAVSVSTITTLIYNYMPSILIYLVWKIITIGNSILEFFISSCNIWMISFILIGYFSLLYLHWRPENSLYFHFSSYAIWLIVSLYISNIFGTYPVIVFCSLQLFFVVGFIYEVLTIIEHEELEGNCLSFMETAINLLLNDYSRTFINTESIDRPLSPDDDVFLDDISETTTKPMDSIGEKASSTPVEKFKPKLKDTTKAMTIDSGRSIFMNSRKSRSSVNVTPTIKFSLPERHFLWKLKADLRMSLDIEDDQVDTDKYMKGTIYACTGMLIWKHKWIIYILIFPVAYYIIKLMGNFFGIWTKIQKYIQGIWNHINEWCDERLDALLPVYIRGLYKVSIIIDQKLTTILKGSIDSVATFAVILGLLFFTTCVAIFITMQVYAEGIHLIQVTGEIVNSSLVNNPDIDWVPEQWEESVNSVLDNAYTYGRSAISDGVKSLVKNLEPAKAELMEKKVLELWDRFYQAWMMSSENSDLIGPTVDMDSVWESFKDSFGKTPFQLFNMTSVQNFAKENVGVLMSVLDSIWSIVKGNMSVILGIVTELIYIVLISGSAVLNFTLSMVVFFTALFYLLSSSGVTYKPIEAITTFSPISCNRFAVALQESVIGVFAATFKLASFFGLWTWFVHNLFQVKIVYLPSVFAMILGAVPFLDAYFACIPVTIELWFTRGPMIATLFFFFHFLPCNIVVTEFYKEIKGGGHPYLTGLSIAGGIFCLGVEGAIFGPLLLCCIMVAINLSRRYMYSPSEETLNTIKSQIHHLKNN